MSDNNDMQAERMLLFREVYTQWSPEVRRFTGNIAEGEAIRAVDSFDRFFGNIK